MIGNDSTPWMLSEAVQMLRMADRLHSQFFRLGVNGAALSWEPPVDMYGGRDELGLLVAMPGVTPDHCEVSLERDAIVVRGRRALSSNWKPGKLFLLEIPYGRFERRIPLPHGGYRIAEMQLEHGCLRLHLERPK